MGKIRKFIERMEQLTIEAQEAELVKIIQKYESIIVGLNTEQLMHGIDAEGKSLGEYRSKAYEAFKKKLNPLGVVDLRLKGNFHGNFFIAVELPLTIWSYDEKTDKLVKKYGANIFGLTTENKKIFALDYLRYEIVDYWKRTLQL